MQKVYQESFPANCGQMIQETMRKFNNTEPVGDLYPPFMPILAVSLAGATLVILLGIGAFCLIRAYDVFT